MERISSVIALILFTAMNCIAQPITQSELGWPLVSGTSAINEPPTATNKVIVMFQGHTITNQVHGHDENPGWYYSVTTNSSHGTTTILDTNTGDFSFAADSGYVGSDNFAFIVHEVDGSLTATGVVQISTINIGNNTNCFNISGATETCYEETNIIVACVTHTPSQPDDGCSTNVPEISGELICTTPSTDANSVCVNTYTGCSGLPNSLSDVTYRTNASYPYTFPFISTNIVYSTSANTFNFRFSQLQGSYHYFGVGFGVCNDVPNGYISIAGIVSFTNAVETLGDIIQFNVIKDNDTGQGTTYYTIRGGCTNLFVRFNIPITVLANTNIIIQVTSYSPFNNRFYSGKFTNTFSQ